MSSAWYRLLLSAGWCPGWFHRRGRGGVSPYAKPRERSQGGTGLGWAGRPWWRRGRVGAGAAPAAGRGWVEGHRGHGGTPALSFAGLLRRLRAEAQMTQEELAEAAALSPRSVSDLERGIHRTAHKDTAVLLAGALSLAGPARELFVSAARGRAPAGDVLAAVYGRPPGALAAAARALPNNLPAQLATFIGRDRELSEVRGLVESCRLVTLTGAGGCGKTRLGLQVAAGLLGRVRRRGLAGGAGRGHRRGRRGAGHLLRRWGSPRSRAGRPWTPCWMPWPRRTC